MRERVMENWRTGELESWRVGKPNTPFLHFSVLGARLWHALAKSVFENSSARLFLILFLVLFLDFFEEEEEKEEEDDDCTRVFQTRSRTPLGD
jgi:hypothetical protein